VDKLSNRIDRVAESVLENESLADGLDRSAAEVLQKWGIEKMTRIAEKTDGQDDEMAERSMYPHLRAMRRLMRAIRNWLRHESDLDCERRAELWQKLLKRAQAVYGSEIAMPSAEEIAGGDAAQFVLSLRAWFEDKKP